MVCVGEKFYNCGQKALMVLFFICWTSNKMTYVPYVILLGIKSSTMWCSEGLDVGIIRNSLQLTTR